MRQNLSLKSAAPLTSPFSTKYMSCLNASHLIQTREYDKFIPSLRSTVPTPFLVFGDKVQFNVSLTGNFYPFHEQ